MLARFTLPCRGTVGARSAPGWGSLCRWSMTPVLENAWLGIRRAVDSGIDRFHDARRPCRYVIVPKSQHPITFCFKPSCPAQIARLVICVAVLRSIHFDDQPRCHAGEVDDVRADRDLSAEMTAGNLKSAQMAP